MGCSHSSASAQPTQPRLRPSPAVTESSRNFFSPRVPERVSTEDFTYSSPLRTGSTLDFNTPPTESPRSCELGESRDAGRVQAGSTLPLRVSSPAEPPAFLCCAVVGAPVELPAEQQPPRVEPPRAAPFIVHEESPPSQSAVAPLASAAGAGGAGPAAANPKPAPAAAPLRTPLRTPLRPLANHLMVDGTPAVTPSDPRWRKRTLGDQPIFVSRLSFDERIEAAMARYNSKKPRREEEPPDPQQLSRPLACRHNSPQSMR